MTKHTSSTAEKESKQKKQGPIRTELLAPVFVVLLLFWAYFFFLFDSHLRFALEAGGTIANGAEVNVKEVRTSFWNASLVIRQIQVTNSESPNYNLVQIGEIRFRMTWDALLRAKILVPEVAVEQIAVGSKRNSPGKVRPLPPPDNQSSAPETSINFTKIVGQAANQASVFGTLGSAFQSGDTNQAVSEIRNQLASEKHLKDLYVFIESKSSEWQARLKTLPSLAVFEGLSNRTKAVKTSGFANPQEALASVQELQKIFEEGQQKTNLVTSARNDLSKDVETIQSDLSKTQQLIDEDLKALQAKMKLPNLDAKSMAEALVGPYLQPYMAHFAKAMDWGKRLAPNPLKGEKSESSIIPHPRSKGATYEFGRPKSYPLFWIQRISISSTASAEFPVEAKGQVLNVTSNQFATGKPTRFEFQGNIPSQKITNIQATGQLDTRPKETQLEISFGVGSAPIEKRPLVASDQGTIEFLKGVSSVSGFASVVGFRTINAEISTRILQPSFSVLSQSQEVNEVLQSALQSVPNITMDVSIRGKAPLPKIEMNSNLGPELSRAINQQIGSRLAEKKNQLRNNIESQIAGARSQVDKGLSSFRSNNSPQIAALDSQSRAQQDNVQKRIQQAKKDSEDRLKSEVEKKAKGAAEELKKRLGF